MSVAVTELISLLEKCIKDEKDPVEREQLYKTLVTAQKVIIKRKENECLNSK